MKFNALFFVIISWFLITPLFGQQDSRRWEVGIDALSLFSKNQLPSYSIFGRYQLNPNAEKESYIRARVGYQIQNFETNTPDAYFFFIDDKELTSLLSIGYQRDFMWYPKHSMYFGGDFTFIRKAYKSDAYYFSEENLIVDSIEGNNFSMNINGLIGFSYKPTGYLKISFESGLYAGRNYMNEDYLAKTESGDRVSWGSISSDRFEFGILPFYQMLLTIVF